MKAVFMGTPDFAVPTLEALADSDDIDLVAAVTQPDSVSKRGNGSVPTPVRVAAEERGIPVQCFETLRTSEAGDALEALEPDVIVVASYGNILTQRILEIPQYGCINVHASLLPRWRGAAPIERAILSGDELTGVSIMKMDEGLDTGSYCMQRVVQIGDMDSGELASTLAHLGAEVVVEAISAMRKGKAVWIDQDDSKSTYAAKIEKSEMMLSPGETASGNVVKVRASTDHAPARAVVCGKPSTLVKARVFDPLVEGFGAGDIGAGEVRRVRKRMLMGCADGTVMQVLSIKPDGRKEMTAADFCSGVHEMLRNGEGSWDSIDAR